MSAYEIANARVVVPGESISPHTLLVEGSRIAAVDPTDLPQGTIRIDCGGHLLTPGLIDIHTHGVGLHAYDCSQPLAEFRAALRLLPEYGTTSVVPTIIPPADVRLLGSLAALKGDGEGSAVMLGYHLEGPFVALGGAACTPTPGDLGLLAEILEPLGDRVRIMSLSPEQENILPVIRRLCEAGIRPFLTHTRASVEQTERAIDAGACHATHFYDVFPVPAETEPGVRPVGAVEAILADPRVSVDFICDGVHAHPAAIRAAVAAKGWRNVLLITDSNVGAGLPAGEYDTPWGYRVAVKPGDAARHATKGFLAGSSLTMNVGMKNLLRWLRLPPEQVWAMGTANPARLLGLPRKGTIATGADADLVLWDEELKPIMTWIAGECVLDRRSLKGRTASAEPAQNS